MKLLLTLILICFSMQSFSQQTDSTYTRPVKGTAAWHLSQKKSLKTAGFLLMSGGTILTLASLNSAITWDIFLTEEEKRKEKAAYTRAWIGLSAMVASIPMFIVANNHKRKAKLILKNENAFLPDPSKRTGFTALAFSLRF